jgi:hypothetical protein
MSGCTIHVFHQTDAVLDDVAMSLAEAVVCERIFITFADGGAVTPLTGC